MDNMLGSVATVMNLAAGLLFYGGLILIVLMLRKISKDIDDVKRSISALESVMMALPRADAAGRQERP